MPTLASRPLEADAFAPFGRAVALPDGPPTSAGKGFDCWFGMAELDARDLRLGQVRAFATDGTVTTMERHPDLELLIAVTGPLVQVVAPGRDLDDATEEPDADKAVAFRMEPGEAVVIAPGVWHAAALPVENETFYLFAGLPHPPEPGREASPWIGFRDGATVTLA